MKFAHDNEGCYIVPAVVFSHMLARWPDNLEEVSLLRIGERKQDYIVRTKDGRKCRAYYIPFFDCFFADDVHERVYK